VSEYSHPSEKFGRFKAAPKKDGDAPRRPVIRYRRTWEAEQALLRRMSEAARPLVTGRDGTIPAELVPIVEHYVKEIKGEVETVNLKFSPTWLLDVKSEMREAEQYARHQAMVSFLGGVGLLDDYFLGREIWPFSLRSIARAGTPLDHEHAQSWAVSIGYLPEPWNQKAIFLSTEFRYGEKMQGFRYGLGGYRHDTPMTPGELREQGLL